VNVRSAYAVSGSGFRSVRLDKQWVLGGIAAANGTGRLAALRLSETGYSAIGECSTELGLLAASVSESDSIGCRLKEKG